MIPKDRMTIGSLAQEKGYRTACIGKWHLGWNWPITPEFTKAERARIMKLLKIGERLGAVELV